jgi:Flp pilus assembly pilin Flp
MIRGRKQKKALPPIDLSSDLSSYLSSDLRTTMKALVLSFVRDEQGQDLVEYALIVAAVGLALITTVNQLSQGIVSLYQSITGDLSSIGAQQ